MEYMFNYTFRISANRISPNTHQYQEEFPFFVSVIEMAMLSYSTDTLDA